MKIIKPTVDLILEDKAIKSFEETTGEFGINLLKRIEEAGRTCYKSEDKITEDSCIKFVENLIKRDHTAMLEFADLTMAFTCDRGVSHEIVRHRLFSFAQESTRYCNYTNDKFGNELTFIEPCFWYTSKNCRTDIDAQKYAQWENTMVICEYNYNTLIQQGATPQEARSVLPNSLKTEIVVKGNIREWRHFFKLRCSKAAHPQMREVALMALYMAHSAVPVVFDDIWVTYREEIRETIR